MQSVISSISRVRSKYGAEQHNLVPAAWEIQSNVHTKTICVALRDICGFYCGSSIINNYIRNEIEIKKESVKV